ncbi:toll/interleukin-1 receptor domain-containing protein [Pedobacter gandavensis]|uniref:toll/interleukin-1 receptor domain-containing protein n=1 Tax=Pedobacter gandavensis TaxID=2679963 RepID=UPI002478E613|nr:toll/interleukin-1 receptor domain-containing protein [Pedobacter gandavensis]WGQ09701.1 toll/interleukin-1 receptor domain-containing protein [Pedobacter gandavensis]
MRDTLFISHATPEDNAFTIWLASRLELLGYRVWIDKNELLGGEKFWSDIEVTITKYAIKFLMVYSNNITYKNAGFEIKAGIQKEINYANQVIIENPDLKDFFTILHIDNAPRNLFPGASDLNQISFEDNWAEGLNTLVKKLEKDQIPKVNVNDTTEAANFYLENFSVENGIVEKEELYYTNWWSIKYLPEHFYIHQFTNEAQSKAVFDKNNELIGFRAANTIISFTSNLDLEVEGRDGHVKVQKREVFKIKVTDLLLGYEKESFPSYRDSENFFKRLLKRTLHLYLKKRKLFWYELANKDQAYYHTHESLPSSKVEFSLAMHDKKKKKNLIGKHLDVGKWHYALSFKPVLFPYLGFHLRSHLIFSETGFGAIKDKDLQHSHRRKKGKRMFNEDWRDLLLAFISSLKNGHDATILDTNSLNQIEMKAEPETFLSKFGYIDPKDKERMGVFVEEIDREEPLNES